MATPILMPQQGNTVEECILLAWKKKKGDTVQSGDIIAEIETDKATFELETPAAGTLLETFFMEGELVPVLTAIGVIGKPGEAVDSFKPDKTRKPAETKVSPATAASKPSTAAPAATVSVAASGEVNTGTSLSPRALRYLQKHAISLEGIRGSGASGRIMEKDLIAKQLPSARLSPLAADYQKEGYRAPDSGSGPAGLVRAGDMLQPGKPLTGIRAIIAERMRASLLSTAQYTVSMQADATALMALRKVIKAKPKDNDITINDLVMFTVVATLSKFPELNAELVDNTLYPHSDINLGFACDTQKGLLVPVIKKSQSLSLSAMAKETKRLAERAQKGNISPDELTGGTFTVSNLGAFGVRSFTPVLNAPQVAILGVCAVSLEPVRKNDRIEYIDALGFSLTANHQVVDGALSARFLQTLCGNIAQITSLTGNL